MRPVNLPFFEAMPRHWQPDEPPTLTGVDTIQLDGEFDGLRWYAGDRPVGWAATYGDRSVYLPFAHRGGGNLPEGRVKEWAQRELRGKHIINHSTKIDVEMMRAWGVNLEEQGCTFSDISHTAALLDDHRLRFNLHELAEDELKIGKLDPGVPKEQISLAPAWQIAPYAKRDTSLVRDLRAALVPRIRKEGLEKVHALENAVIPAVVEMEWNGVPYDQEMLDAWLLRIEQIETDYLWELRRSFGFDVDPGNKTHLAKVFRTVGLKPGRKVRKSKDPIKNGTVYDSYASEYIIDGVVDYPKLEPLARVILLRSLRSKALQPLKDDGINGLYTPTYHQLRSADAEGETRGVVSGRFSAPLIHQITGKSKYKKKYGAFGSRHETFWARELFREVDGHWFCADMKQCQYRIMVHRSGSERLLQMYRDDPMTNFHGKVEGWMRPLRPDITETEVKIGNFLTIFGGGAAATAQFFKCTPEQANEFRDVYFQALPEARDTIDKVRNDAERYGFVTSVLGRRSRFPHGTWVDRWGRQIRGRLRTHKSLNCECQMNEADVFKTKMVALHGERKRLGLTPRVNMHDEWDGRLADPAVVPEIMAILNRQDIAFRVPLLWSGGVSDSWATAK